MDRLMNYIRDENTNLRATAVKNPSITVCQMLENIVKFPIS